MNCDGTIHARYVPAIRTRYVANTMLHSAFAAAPQPRGRASRKSSIAIFSASGLSAAGLTAAKSVEIAVSIHSSRQSGDLNIVTSQYRALHRDFHCRGTRGHPMGWDIDRSIGPAGPVLRTSHPLRRPSSTMRPPSAKRVDRPLWLGFTGSPVSIDQLNVDSQPKLLLRSAFLCFRLIARLLS